VLLRQPGMVCDVSTHARQPYPPGASRLAPPPPPPTPSPSPAPPPPLSLRNAVTLTFELRQVPWALAWAAWRWSSGLARNCASMCLWTVSLQPASQPASHCTAYITAFRTLSLRAIRSVA
jgi:hypothetical protein